jgi:Tol biopolymer transport system component
VGARQIHSVDRSKGTTRAITQGAADSWNPDVDDSGRFVVFESNADFFASGLTGTQVYRIDLRRADPTCPYPCPSKGNLGLIRVTNKSGTSRNAVTSKTGKVVVFESDADLLDEGAVGTQVYLFDVRFGTLTRISSGPGQSRNPTVARTGRLVAFESDDGVGGTEVILFKRTLGTSLPLASMPGTLNTRPSMEATGRGVIFTSDGDLLDSGSTGPEVFRYDIPEGTLRQVTSAPNTVSDSSHSAGVFLTFLADGDLLGNGSTSVELYLVNLFALGAALAP